jgi:hypothetical protein
MLSIPKPNKQAVKLAKEVLASANISYQAEAVEYNKACVPEDRLEGYINNWFKYNKNASDADKAKMDSMKFVDEDQAQVFSIQIGTENKFEISVFCVKRINGVYNIYRCNYTRVIELTTFSNVWNWMFGIDSARNKKIIDALNQPLTLEGVKALMINNLVKELLARTEDQLKIKNYELIEF